MNASQPDLRTFLDDLKGHLPNQLLTIADTVPLDYTSTALTMLLEKQGRSPVLLFEHLAGYDFRLVANLFASRALMAHAIGTDRAGFNAYFGDCLDHLLKAEVGPAGPVQEVVWTGSALDLNKLPIPRHFTGDAGAYITAGITVARDPDTGVNNLSYARLQVKGTNKLGVSLHSHQHLWDYQRRAEENGMDLPVAVVIGCHPAVMIAAAAKMGIDQDEYDLAGALLKQPLALCPGRTVDVPVPANAEIVIEGRLLAGVREDEGPFGEYTGYMTGRSTRHVLEVSAVTLRKDAIFVDIVPGNSAEHLILGAASKEAWLYKRMKEALPFFIDFHYPSSGTHFHCYLRIHKTAEGQAKQAAELLMGLDHYVKLAVVVDQDIDPSDENSVMWSVATRTQADQDVNILSGLMCNQLDPSSKGSIGAKMMIDATMPLDSTAERLILPDAAEALAQRLLENSARS